MSDDDDNLVNFNKAFEESKSNNAPSVEERVIQCMSTSNCNCKYCTYKKNAADMVVDFIARDIMTFEKNTNSKMCTYDMKEILIKAVMRIKDLEKDGEK